MVEMVDYDVADDEPMPIEVEAEESTLDVIRRRRSEHVADQFYDMVVPGYKGCLVLRCGPLSPETQTMTRMRLQRLERKQDPTRDFAINADTLLAVCEEVLARKTRSSPLEPLIAGETIRLDVRLAEVLGCAEEATTARMLVRELFRGAPSPEISVGIHVNDYLEWAQGVESDVDEELLGES